MAGGWCPRHGGNLERTGYLNPCEVDGCDRMAERDMRHGIGHRHCKTHGQQVYQGRTIGPIQPMPPRGDTLARFMSHVKGNPDTGCWEWTGIVDDRKGEGYGRFYLDGQRQWMPPHRWAWANVAGRELDPALVIDHICENKLCVRPGHLQQVPTGTNTRLFYARADTPVPGGYVVVAPNQHQTAREWALGVAHGLPVAEPGQGSIILEPFDDSQDVVGKSVG